MRWKYFIPTVVITALIVVFNVLFLDYVLKLSIIATGEMIFGAKVEVSSVKTRFGNLSIDIKGLKAANKGDVFKNLFEIDEIRFSVKPAPLLSMKVIIDEMAVDGVKWATKRDSSGALPPVKQAKYARQQQKDDKNGFFSKLSDKILDKGKSQFGQLPALGDIKNSQQQFKNFSFDKAISAEDLQSVKELETMKQGVNDKYSKYQDRLKKLDADDNINKAAAQVSDLSKIKVSSPQDVQALKTKLDGLNGTKDELDKSAKELQNLRAQAESDFGSDKDLLANINELKDNDIKALSAKYKLPSFTTTGVAGALFGPVWLSRVQKAIYYVGVVRKYMPPRKKNAKTATVQGARGTDVSFPKADTPPDFLISKTSLSGTTGGAGKEGTPLDFKGEIDDITSDQSQLGRPTTFEINGVMGPKTLKASGNFDHRTDDASDTFNFTYTGLTAKEMNLPKSEYLPSFDKGEGKVNGNFTMRGEDIDASVDIVLTNFQLPDADKTDEAKNIVASLWSGIDSIAVTAKLTGKIDKIDIAVSSNIDKTLSDRLTKLYGEKIAEIQNKIRSEVDRLTNEKKAEVTAQYNAKRNELMNAFTGKQKELQEKTDELSKMKDSKENEAKNLVSNAKKQAEDLTEAQKKQAEARAEAAKKQAQEQLDAEKKKAEEAAKKQAEEEVKKKAQQQLKGLFGQ